MIGVIDRPALLTPFNESDFKGQHFIIVGI